MKFKSGELLEYIFSPKTPTTPTTLTTPTRPLSSFENTSYSGRSGRFVERLLDRPKDQSQELINFYGKGNQTSLSLDPRASEGMQKDLSSGIFRMNTAFRNPKTVYLAPGQQIGAYQPFAGKENQFIPKHLRIG